MRTPVEMALLLRERLTQAEYVELLDALDTADDQLYSEVCRVVEAECPALFADDELTDLISDDRPVASHTEELPVLDWSQPCGGPCAHMFHPR